jgi:biopolymer transport protein TolR
MGASAGGARGGYQRRNSRRRSSGGAISEINVTPLVDVMLVLLIVFMVAAPLMTVGVPIELPKTEASQMDSSTEPITISVQEDGKVFLMETEIVLETLAPKLIAIAKNGYEEQLFVRADTSVPYGKVMEVMGLLNGAGYRKIGLVTGTPDPKPLAAETQN